MDWNTLRWALPLGYALIINLVAFIAMGVDKARSKKENKRRIPEKRLFLLALIGGSVGAVWGMFHFRHKTRHWYFRWGLPAILAAQAALLLWLWLR